MYTLGYQKVKTLDFKSQLAKDTFSIDINVIGAKPSQISIRIQRYFLF